MGVRVFHHQGMEMIKVSIEWYWFRHEYWFHHAFLDHMEAGVGVRFDIVFGVRGEPSCEREVRFDFDPKLLFYHHLWRDARDILKGGQRSVDTVWFLRHVGKKYKRYKERSTRELQAWAVKYKTKQDMCEAKKAYEDIKYRDDEDLVQIAEMVRDMALTNGGFQVKLCQMLAMKKALLPEKIRAPLKECLDKAWSVPLSVILPNIEHAKYGFGCNHHEIFETIESEAMAAASIAQVHRAVLRCPTYQEVLVKVQHPGVRDSLKADVAILPYMIQFMDKINPNHGLRPFLYMLSAMLEQEVDFRIEGANRERLAAIMERSKFSKRSKHCTLRFPRVMWKYCARSAMIQEFMENAVSLGDRRVVERAGIPYTLALDELVSFFAECCFVHGYMHNDLHVGNALVRLVPDDARSSTRVQALARKCSVVVLCPIANTTLLLFNRLLRIIASAVVSILFVSINILFFFFGGHLRVFAGNLTCREICKFLGKRNSRIIEFYVALHQRAKLKGDMYIAGIANIHFELIIIDHGFHTHVSYEHRLAWCKLWAGIGLCDEELLKEGSTDFGIDDQDYRKMTMILILFPYPVWRDRRFCSVSEFLDHLDSSNKHEYGYAASQSVKNQRLPKQFHLMHRTSQQIFAYFHAEYGVGYEAAYHFLEHMTKFSLLGLRFRNRAGSTFPVPGKLHTATGQWFDIESAAVEDYMRTHFFWDRPSSSRLETLNSRKKILGLRVRGALPVPYSGLVFKRIVQGYRFISD
ncbi:hypothetical protein AURANDRAFT_67477 [Aureococcus anophagefferens]|uniref:ABC1 atypical kinase-like domain-containing protein n=1 Tax=Aureococcus anophagefferens TaxID=44056 RepID=F0YLA4_AURAN|nr:hypothetical protein AURANDRAFT_67477 [Aureococcus anophagefferens]EGB04116.1 hypothetical protein AURANDRAFT_67477 [Aureococcus anophagefferens]|eukprot:XP_009041241.1 hypothetical protein AURANDRAFT_67477 [Aureococcus anophagefferens]